MSDACAQELLKNFGVRKLPFLRLVVDAKAILHLIDKRPMLILKPLIDNRFCRIAHAMWMHNEYTVQYFKTEEGNATDNGKKNFYEYCTDADRAVFVHAAIHNYCKNPTRDMLRVPKVEVYTISEDTNAPPFTSKCVLMQPAFTMTAAAHLRTLAKEKPGEVEARVLQILLSTLRTLTELQTAANFTHGRLTIEHIMSEKDEPQSWYLTDFTSACLKVNNYTIKCYRHEKNRHLSHDVITLLKSMWSLEDGLPRDDVDSFAVTYLQLGKDDKNVRPIRSALRKIVPFVEAMTEKIKSDERCVPEFLLKKLEAKDCTFSQCNIKHDFVYVNKEDGTQAVCMFCKANIEVFVVD